MWHAAVDSRKYQRFLVNEYNTQQCDFLRDCAMGMYDDCNEWVSRKQFMRDVQKSKFLQAVWSFGNLDSYFCASVLEDWEMALQIHLVYKLQELLLLLEYDIIYAEHEMQKIRN